MDKSESSREPVCDFILENTTTIGVRYHAVELKELERENVSLNTQYGAVKAKRVITPSGKIRVKPEHDGLQGIAVNTGVSVLQLKREFESGSVD